MAWYNPMDWARATTRLAYRTASYGASMVGAKDTAEFLYTAGDPSYVAKSFRTANALTSDGRKEQSAEAHRYTDNVVNNIAPGIETKAVTGAQAIATVLTGPMSGVLVEQGTDALLAAEGEAPTRSLIKMYSPISQDADFGTVGNFVADGFRGDKYYQQHNKIDGHPDRQAYLAGNQPASSSETPGFFAQLSKLPFGIGTLIGVGLGLAAAFVNPIAGIAIAALGGYFGEGLWEKGKEMIASSKEPAQPVATTAPVTNHPRTETKTAEPEVKAPPATLGKSTQAQQVIG